MNHYSETRRGYLVPLKTITVVVVFLLLAGIIQAGFRKEKRMPFWKEEDVLAKDSIASAEAFEEVYKVLMHPRCMNCHPKGDVPLQGDDSHLHTMSPRRGANGNGVYAMKCKNCHQPENTPGLHTPPGNPKWALPPSDMKMVFEGKTAHELAVQIMDYNRNGHKTKAKLLEHAKDTLVKAGWNMGEGRVSPPLSYNEFVKAWDTWIEKGGYAPKAK
jgi:hypothetical protein